jgi:NAD(P)-dependent dehydrogenase (short-subunit alcohol dehydrogenase family)
MGAVARHQYFKRVLCRPGYRAHPIRRDHGKIINIAAVQSELARPGIAPYTATKGAVKNLTRGMRADCAKYGLQINATAPGYSETALNQALVDNPEFSSWLEKRTPAGRWEMSMSLLGPLCSCPATFRPSSTDIRSTSMAGSLSASRCAASRPR